MIRPLISPYLENLSKTSTVVVVTEVETEGSPWTHRVMIKEVSMGGLLLEYVDGAQAWIGWPRIAYIDPLVNGEPQKRPR